VCKRPKSTRDDNIGGVGDIQHHIHQVHNISSLKTTSYSI
jgi:hypothetical protein